MKKYSLLTLLCLPFLINAQIIRGYIFDKNTKHPIIYANILLIQSKNGAYTNKEGFFELEIEDKDSLQISSVGYKTKYVDLRKYKVENLKIELEELEYELEEVALNFKKNKYTKRKKLGLERVGKYSSSKLIGYNTAIYIKNKENRKGKLKTIHLYLNKTRKKTGWKAPVFLAKLNIHIYEYDSINNKPGKELLHQNLIVKPKNRKYVLDIDVKDLNIIFPKKGICISVEFIDEHNKYKKHDHLGPSLRYTKSNNKKITWSNYRNRGWKNGFLRHKTEIANLLLNVDVLFPKK